MSSNTRLNKLSSHQSYFHTSFVNSPSILPTFVSLIISEKIPQVVKTHFNTLKSKTTYQLHQIIPSNLSSSFSDFKMLHNNNFTANQRLLIKKQQYDMEKKCELEMNYKEEKIIEKQNKIDQQNIFKEIEINNRKYIENIINTQYQIIKEVEQQLRVELQRELNKLIIQFEKQTEKSDKKSRQKQQKLKKDIDQIKRKYKQQILISQKNMYQQFTQNQILNHQINALKNQNNRLNTQILQQKNIIQQLQKQLLLIKKMLQQEQQTVSHLQRHHLIIQQQIMIRLQNKIQANIQQYKQSRQTSDNLNFETFSQSQQRSILREDWILSNKIEELEMELKIKDELILGFQKYINEPSIIDLNEIAKSIKKTDIKQKYRNYRCIIQQNIYLKKCLQKLTRSEMFWNAIKQKQQENQPQQLQQYQKDLKKQSKCFIF